MFSWNSSKKYFVPIRHYKSGVQTVPHACCPWQFQAVLTLVREKYIKFADRCVFFSNYRFSLFQKRPNWLWGPPSFLFNWYQGSFSGVKRQGREANNSHWVELYAYSPICLHALDMKTLVTIFPNWKWHAL
jgi:hypothetical protein